MKVGEEEKKLILCGKSRFLLTFAKTHFAKLLKSWSVKGREAEIDEELEHGFL